MILEQGITMVEGSIGGAIIALLATFGYGTAKFIKWFADKFINSMDSASEAQNNLAKAATALVEEVKKGGEESRLDRQVMDTSSRLMIRSVDSLDAAVRVLNETNKIMMKDKVEIYED